MLSGRKPFDLQPQSSQKGCLLDTSNLCRTWRIAQALPKSPLLHFKSPEEPLRCKLKARLFLTVSVTGNPHAWRSGSGVWGLVTLGKGF